MYMYIALALQDPLGILMGFPCDSKFGIRK